ncbi:acyl carrier protein, partial [Actinomadura bangladeshensis]
PPLAGLVPATPATRSAPAADPAAVAAGLRERLAGLDETDQRQLVLDLVLRHAATVLGHGDGTEIDPDDAFEKLGMDSLTAVQIRNQLALSTGLRLPATAVYDYPAPAALADHLHRLLAPPAAAPPAADLPMRDVRRLLESVRPTRPGDAELLRALLVLAETRGTSHGRAAPAVPAAPAASARRSEIREMDADGLISMGLGIARHRKGEPE